MKYRPGPYKPALCAADCYDWISPEDVMRHALAAFYASCRSVDEWERENGAEPSAILRAVGRPALALDMAERFLQRLNEAGLQARLREFKPDRHELAEIQAWAPDMFREVDDTGPERARARGPSPSIEYVDNSQRVSPETLPNIHRRAFKLHCAQISSPGKSSSSSLISA